MKIAIITTGGTIDKVYFDAKSHYQVGDSEVSRILAESHVDVEREVVNILAKDSLDITADDRALIRRVVEHRSERHILITHGTDGMVETGRVLKSVPGKVIVMTGSLAPARFRASDAPFNLGMAIAALQTLPEGVWIAMNGRIFAADRVRKNREKNCFEETSTAT
ncbi:MAG: asparaginase domain-containing protein [bacterium]